MRTLTKLSRDVDYFICPTIAPEGILIDTHHLFFLFLFLLFFCCFLLGFFQRMASRGEALIAVKDFGEKGRGVVALRNFSRGDLIEEAHCIYFPKEEVDLSNKTILKEYTFVAGF